jgi:hypothetical protein
MEIIVGNRYGKLFYHKYIKSEQHKWIYERNILYLHITKKKFIKYLVIKIIYTTFDISIRSLTY